jgi:hypothetical protein
MQQERRPSASRVKEIMRDSDALPMPDYNALAADFDRFLPLIHPVSLAPHLPKEHVSPAERLKEWAADGARTRLLEDAGLRVVRSEMFSWMYRFASFEEAWELLGRMGGFTGQAALSAEAQRDVKRELLASLAAYRQAAGEYVIPHACRLIWGQR